MSLAKPIAPLRSPVAGQDISFDPVSDRCDAIIELLLIALAIFAPLPFGSVEPWSQQIVICASAAISAIFCYRLLACRQTPLVGSAALLPICLFVLLALFQLLPLPASFLKLISPETWRLKTHLLADLPGAIGSSSPLTFYGWATRFNLRLLCAVIAIFIVTLNVFRSPRRIRRLLGGLSIAAGIIAALALSQDFTGATKVFWTFDDPYIRRATAGPFIHYNSFCQFMNLGVGAALALLMVRLAEVRSGKRRGEYISPAAAPRRWAINAALLAVVVGGAAAVLLSMSRSGAIALVAAGCLTLMLLSREWGAQRTGWIAGLVLIFVLGVGLCIGLDSVLGRISTLRHPIEVAGGRWQIFLDVLRESRSFPVLGTGLGTHEFIYPRYISFPSTFTYTHAENEYVQMLEEVGIAGVAMVLWFIGLIVAAAITVIRHRRRSIDSAIYGLTFGIAAVLVQSCADFGQHLLANAVLLSMEFALVLSLARLARERSRRHSAAIDGAAVSRAPIRSVFSAAAGWQFALAPRLILLIVVVASFSWSIFNAERSRRSADSFWQARAIGGRVGEQGWHVPASTGEDLLSLSDAAVRADPNNVECRYWAALYKWNWLIRDHDPSLPDDAFSPRDRATASRIVGEFDQIRRLCPSYGLAASMSGMISLFTLDNPRGAEAIRLSYELLKNNPAVDEIVVSMYARAGDADKALAVCRYYLTLQGQPPPPIVPANLSEILVHEAKRPDLAVRMAGDDPDRLWEVVASIRAEISHPEWRPLAQDLDKKAGSLRKARLEVVCAGQGARADDLAALAEILRSENKPARAIEYYQRALVLNYDQVEWRLNLARALLADGRVKEAVSQARICLHLQPDDGAAIDLIEQARKLPGVSLDPS